jgi:hypothetical protein
MGAAALGEVGFAAAFAADQRGDFFDDGSGVGGAVGDVNLNVLDCESNLIHLDVDA